MSHLPKNIQFVTLNYKPKDELIVIYLIERSHKGLSSVSTLLMGNFAVQCFASFQSFCSMIPSCEEQILLAVVGSDFQKEVVNKEVGDIQKRFKNALIVLISEADNQRVWMSSRLFLYPENDLENLVFQLKDLMPDSQRSLSDKKDYRSFLPSQELTAVGDCLFDLEGLRIYSAADTSEYLDLTVKESRILNLLIRSETAVVSREYMREIVWPDAVVSSRTIDSHISRLRKRLNDFGMSIDCQYGKGYQLSSSASFD